MIFLQFALRNLQRHWIRSLLSIIGIIIGVIAIASLAILGNSINLLVANVITDVGDTLVISPHTAASETFVGDPRQAVDATIGANQVNEIRRAAGSHRVIPVLMGAEVIRFGDEGGNAQIIGLATDDIPFLLDLDRGQYVRQNLPGCLIGSFLADEFELEPGNRILIGDEEIRVVGILRERGYAADINPDYAVVVAEPWYSDYFETADEYSMVIVKVRSLGEIDAVKDAIDYQLNRREDTVDIIDSRDLIKTYEEIYDQMTMFLIGIGAISLIVAAVNILNVMYISVTERIHEIGIMRSIGTNRRDVLQMFLFEAIVLGVIGSIVGGFFSTIGGYIISAVAIEAFTVGTTFGENATIFDSTAVAYVFFAMGFGIVISALSGLYPAWKAAQLSPIEALRHE
ncbi:MAG: multidrug ABC transporter substrate-binding protein [Methanoculleus sp. SDB]|nr:MAG: multidrug ABC transporter substrate-binding protein [Methanoculleus sp. SDB]